MISPHSDDACYVAWHLADPRPSGAGVQVAAVARNLDEVLAAVAASDVAAFLPHSVADGRRHTGVRHQPVPGLEPAAFGIAVAKERPSRARDDFVAIVKSVADGWDEGPSVCADPAFAGA